MKTIVRASVSLLLAGAVLAGPAAAAREFERTVAARADGVVSVQNIAGRIEVTGWDRKEVSVEAVLHGAAEEVVVKDGRRVSIRVKYPRRMKNLAASADLVIRVPHGSRLDVEGISAQIVVRGVSGEVDAEAISGDITVAADCDEVEAETISGDIRIESGAREISVGSISGTVEVRGAEAEVEAETVSGSLRLVCDRFLGLEVESVSGSADVAGDLHPRGEFSFEMHSGDLVLTVPGDVDASFHVATFNGGIDNGFGQKSRRTSKYAPGRELEFSNGDGGARVRIDTFSGDVVIRKK